MNFHNEINKDIKFLAKSEIRLKILSELYVQPNNVRGLVKKTNITYSSVSSNIAKLEQNDHIKKISKKYHLNPISEIYFKTLMDFKNSVDLIRDYDGFWDKHDLNQLSMDSLKNITDLKDSELIETTPLDIYKTHNTVKKQLIKSKSLKAIFPYLHPEYPQLIENILNNEGYVELIIPKGIYQAIISQIDLKTRKNASRTKNLNIYPVDNDLKIYLTISDRSMSLGLFKNDDSFDQNRILISETEKSQEWAENLFRNIKCEVIK
ncbi:helix-turn-helix transcriptional regulator [Methanobrevibacter sp.]|uniref:helix-turn-helix transcriptional regulator n=1 Tax=Methanobrevibacter sp. TaxID=66852 RepID=UPI00388F32A3